MSCSAQVTTLFDFASQSINPGGGLVEVAAGQFLGVGFTTQQNMSTLVIYGLSLTGNFKTLFTSTPISGCASTSVPPVEGSDGNLYGSYTVTPCSGGATTSQLFKYVRSSKQLTLFSGSDAYPAGPPIEGFNGNFYGTLNPGNQSPASLYSLTKSGTLKHLVDFSTLTYGPPSDTVVQTTDGALWGATDATGTEIGALYKFQASTLTAPFLFNDQRAGFLPSGIILGPDGKFYGTTTGGVYPSGTVFSYDATSQGDTYAELYTFPAPYSSPGLAFNRPPLYLPGGVLAGLVSSGTGSYSLFQFNPHIGFIRYDAVPLQNAASTPVGYLVQSVMGTVVGLNTDGTTGQAFQTAGTPPPPAITALSPNTGAVGTSFLVRGNYLLSSTSVTVNGKAATYTVKANTAISVVVPTGATSGAVVVTTGNGTATSPVIFTVTP